MLNTTRVVLAIITYLVLQTSCNAQYTIDEENGCPIGVDHVCEICAEDQNRWGCYCELKDGGVLVTASLYTSCPADIEDPCSKNECKNGATCVREGLTGYKCECASGYGGTLCNETLPTCANLNPPCLNAECVETNDPNVPIYCQCYDGTRRDPRQNDTCPPSPCYEKDTTVPVCKNNANCTIFNNSYFCECTKGFAGKNCNRTLKQPYCEDRPGVCGVGKCQQSLTPPYYTCNCGVYPNTFGKELVDLTKCEESGCYAANPCQNGGTCSNKAGGAFLCQCPPRFTGSKCEKNSSCFNNPCVNNGICEAFNETVFFCKCPPYFTGQRCENILPDPCIGKTCGPHGECRDIQGSAICYCNDGLHLDGSPCQDPCNNISCEPGVCTKHPNITYAAICSCPPDRHGEFCELPRDPCRESARCGGGYCIPKYSNPRGYACVCEGGAVQNYPCPFSQNCPIKDCGTKGICVETDGIVTTPGSKPIYYVCQCQEGYISAGSCDELLNTVVPNTVSTCGPNGKPYPSRNPNNPIGCWCKNGTHIEQLPPSGPTPHCL